MYFPRHPSRIVRSSSSSNHRSSKPAAVARAAAWQTKVLAAAATLSALSWSGARVTAERARSLFPTTTTASAAAFVVAVPPTTTTAAAAAAAAGTGGGAAVRAVHSNPNRQQPAAEQIIVWPPQRTATTAASRSSIPRYSFNNNNNHHHHPTLSTARLYHSSPLRNRGDDDDDSENSNFLARLGEKAKTVAKKFLPRKWFMSDEEKRRAQEMERVQREVKGGLQQVLKDAPLPIRMLGGAIAPLFSSLLSVAADTMAEQQDTVDAVLRQARACLVADAAVARALGGGDVAVGAPFSQASSSTSINGQTTVRVELAMPVTASSSQGVARVVATSSGGNEPPSLQLLEVQVNGRVIPVSTVSPRFSASSSGSSSRVGGGEDDIIEAEIIEERRNRP